MNRSIFRLMLIVALVVQGTARAVHAQNVNHNFEVSKNLDIFNALYRDLDLYYVDTLDAQKNIDNAANYIPSTLPSKILLNSSNLLRDAMLALGR